MALQLVSFDICPFVQRSSIALQHLGVDHDIEYIDLANKPDWFLAISPRGKVPLLRTDEGVLFESMAILEYLDETVGKNSLLPESAFDRARSRAWVSTLSDLYGPSYVLSICDDEVKARGTAETLHKGLAVIEGETPADGWFMGGFSQVDCVAAPLLQRLLWIDEEAPQLGLFEGLPKVRAYAERLVKHPAVVASTVPDVRDRVMAYSSMRDAWFLSATA